jgi:hypothetical protein
MPWLRHNSRTDLSAGPIESAALDDVSSDGSIMAFTLSIDQGAIYWMPGADRTVKLFARTMFRPR